MMRLKVINVNHICFLKHCIISMIRYNMVNVKRGDAIIVDPTTIVAICVHYFKEFLGSQLFMMHEFNKAP